MKYVLLSDLEEAKEIMYGLDKGGVYCVRMSDVRALAKEDDLGEYSDKLWKKAYERGKAEALSAEGEYIKKEDVIKYIDEMPSELTEDGRRMVRQIRLKEFVADLPTYSFPDREKGTDGTLVYNVNGHFYGVMGGDAIMDRMRGKANE